MLVLSFPHILEAFGSFSDSLEKKPLLPFLFRCQLLLHRHCVVVVVIFSVIAQGALVPSAAHLLRLPMRTVEPEPWALGVRLRDEPSGAHRFTVAQGAPADGHSIEELTNLPGDVWVSFLVREQQLVPVTGETLLRHGDEVLVLAEPDLYEQLAATFERPE